MQRRPQVDHRPPQSAGAVGQTPHMGAVDSSSRALDAEVQIRRRWWWLLPSSEEGRLQARGVWACLGILPVTSSMGSGHTCLRWGRIVTGSVCSSQPCPQIRSRDRGSAPHHSSRGGHR